MKRMSFRNGGVLLRDRSTDRLSAAVVDGRIAALSDHADSDDGLDLEGGFLVPGFIDTQVNGGGGVLFNDDISVPAIRRIAASHAAFGTTALLPTLISANLADIARALDAVGAAIEQGVPGVVGVHIEGPFLNRLRKGIHNEARFRPLDDEAIVLLTRPRGGRVMVTIAPELTEPATIRRLVDGGVIVSAGHSESDYATMIAAFDAGVSGVTHLYNAMTPLHHRDPGVVGAALDCRRAWCGLIADGYHVHDAALRVAIRALGDRAMLVTDAMSSVGAEAKDFVLDGRPIRVIDGKCVDDKGTLAGSDLDMTGAVRNTVALGIPIDQASRMAAANPAAFLGLADDRGAIAVGQRADWVWLSPDLNHRATWIGGERIA